MSDIVPKWAYNRRMEKMNQICRYLFFGWSAAQVMKLGLQGQIGTFKVLMGGGAKMVHLGAQKHRKNGKSVPTLKIGSVFL